VPMASRTGEGSVPPNCTPSHSTRRCRRAPDAAAPRPHPAARRPCRPCSAGAAHRHRTRAPRQGFAQAGLQGVAQGGNARPRQGPSRHGGRQPQSRRCPARFSVPPRRLRSW
jgi:hypothetical protein